MFMRWSVAGPIAVGLEGPASSSGLPENDATAIRAPQSVGSSFSAAELMQ